MTYDDWLMSGPGGPHDAIPVTCPQCMDREPLVFSCPLCESSGLIDPRNALSIERYIEECE